MASSRKRTTSPASSPATGSGKKMKHSIQEEQLPSSQPSEICTYWPANPAFDLKRVLLRRMFFINEGKTKYMSVGFYPARDYQPLVEFGAFGAEGPIPSFSPTNKSRRWRTVCPRYVTPCVSVGTRSSSSARVATFGCTLRKGTARTDCLSARNT